MKRFRADEDRLDHLEPTLAETEEWIRQAFQSTEPASTVVLEKTLEKLARLRVKRPSFAARVVTVLGTASVIVGTFGGIAVLAFVLLQIGQDSTVPLLGEAIYSGQELLALILSCSSALLGLTLIGYSMVRRNETRSKRLEGTTTILLVGIAAALVGAAVDLSLGWLHNIVTPGVLMAIGVSFGSLVALGSGSFTKFIRNLSTIAVALTGVVLLTIGIVSMSVIGFGIFNSVDAHAFGQMFPLTT
jgi:hypothetical protein